MREERGSLTDHEEAQAPLSWLDRQLGRCPVVTIPIKVLHPGNSPRSDGESTEHVQLIAESGADLPPIIVHQETMRVIDGMHRVKAAVLRGAAQIEARLYQGDADDAFVVSVQANVGHGLPLTLKDRVRAATRIVGSHPRWSDRAIASTVGLSPKTVAAIRLRSAADTGSPTRIGRDGRIRPVSTAASRRLAGELMTCNPDASLRQIATAVGLAPSTVMDVRARLLAGQDLVPGNQHPDGEAPVEPKSGAVRRRRGAAGGIAPRFTVTDRASALGILRHDPSLRLSETGRHLLRLLEAQPTGVPDWRRVVDNVPEHCLAVVTELARDSAKAWFEVTELLEQRTRHRLRQAGS
ncbi:ParB/RepB/Spo0J family partition protein [Actinosynnema sp. NPDC020468]|uniref:ParB/RepB/Spo0J family partition protein n=1 Tax=Actinosynnema sp. NPDC020468 TaxID=3154488 RepID=UPI0033C7CD04